jgi:gag-polypeptide of LTR copia-type
MVAPIPPPTFAKLTHGNYHSWKLQASGRLKSHRVWRIVEGSDTQPDTPTPLSASAKKVEWSMHELAMEALREWQLRNDMATGLIIEMISEDQEWHIENYTSAKDLWDKLQTVHECMHTGIASFYIKIGILEKKFIEGDSMQAHIDFLTLENQKLAASKTSFNDKFMAQVILMSLPRPSTWDTVAITLLQSALNSKPLSTSDVTARLLQEASHIAGIKANSSNSVLYSHNRAKNLPTSSTTPKCCFWKRSGHVKSECQKWKKKKEEMKGDLSDDPSAVSDTTHN